MRLSDFFLQYKKVAVAFSGGVDSAYLLFAAKSCGAKVCAYYVKSEFQPQFEYEDALRFAAEADVELKVLELPVLENTNICKNPKDRCYHCKRMIFDAIAKAAAADDFSVLLDGTNASDDATDRPGMRALKEFFVHSPLRECGLTKEEIRRLSKEAGLFTWDKPAYACLATRISPGEKITQEKLTAVEAAENFLFSLGFTDVRVRIQEKNAKIQLIEEDFFQLMENRKAVLEEFRKYFDTVTLDLQARNYSGGLR